MIWITHLVFAALIFLFIRAPLKLSWIALPVCLFAAVFPDLDHKNSKISSSMGITSRIVSLIFNHRGIIHSLVSAVTFSVLIYLAMETLGWPVNYSYAFFIGYISHLLIDSLNPMGVAWLSPFKDGRAKSVIPCGGAVEIVLLILLSAATAMKFVKII